MLEQPQKIGVPVKPKFNLDYVAGFFDGEGCVCIARSLRRTNNRSVEYILSVGIGNTYAPIVYFLKDSFGGSIHLNLASKKKETYKPFFQWYLSGKKAQKFLETIVPHLIVKKEQAEIGIAFQKCKSTLKIRGRVTSDERRGTFEDFRLKLASSRTGDNLQYTGPISREGQGNLEPSTTTRRTACGTLAGDIV